MKTGATTVENSMEILQNLKVGLQYHPEIPLPGIYAKEIKSLIQKNNLHSQLL